MKLMSLLLFRCFLPLDPFDPQFQQGEEIFMEVGLDQNARGIIKLERMTGKTSELNTQSDYHFENSAFSLNWKEGYLSMVYLGGKTWGAFLNQKALANYPKEIEFLCEEITENVDSLSSP